ncbi:chromate transporter [Fervidibacillus halotolerans]|uniref:Chromate transporter n=1 Tax=Fervidibacillus halotolerans TaxID=2980027 RepID=A0A9E8LYE2_9BACI|nr:chromate transporter [Fervidibacillus halotolerans]WAA12012.1 chromate transporter [Fervidibacillus halotolerans]
MQYINIFLAFFRAGIFGYGGGPSSIPLVHKEVVKRYKWMDDEEFSDCLALGNALPGPIATKLAGYIGYRVGGFLGLIVALIATILPTVFLMIIFLTVLNRYKDQPWVQGMSKAVIPVVGVMLGILTWEFVKRTKSSFGWLKSVLLLVGSFLLMEPLSIHPAILIIFLIIAALFKKTDDSTKSEQKVKAR